MKRIEAIIPHEKTTELNEALKKAGSEVRTILAKGRGKGEKAVVESGRGTARFVSEFSVRSNFVIIVGDSEVDKVITTILGAIHTGSTGDGKIFISPVNDAIDIGTRKKGETAVV